MLLAAQKEVYEFRALDLLLGYLVGGYGHHKRGCGREVATRGVSVGSLCGASDHGRCPGLQRKSRHEAED